MKVSSWLRLTAKIVSNLERVSETPAGSCIEVIGKISRGKRALYYF